MSDVPTKGPVEAGSSRRSTAIFAILATLAFVFVFERSAQFLPRSEARFKRWEASLANEEKRSKEASDKYSDDQKRWEALLLRQEQNTARFEKILDTWEQQQKAYQVYLDSLKHL